MTTEVAHALEVAKSPKTGLYCRFLRFRPLAYNGRPAMRVGVYGTGLDKVDSGKDGVVQTERMIEYSVCHIRNEVNMRRVFGCCAYGCQKCSKYRGICKRPNEEGLRGVR